jgi:phage terminase Nu1 subunit (DNA packaging protein)
MFEGDDDDSRWRGLTKAELCAATGLTLNQISKYTGEGMPGKAPRSRNQDWKFDLRDVFEWIASRSANPVEDAKRQNLQATARKRRAEADRIEGNLIQLDRVTTIFADARANFQSELVHVADQCPLECRDVVRGLHIAAINRLASAAMDKLK